MDGVFKFINNVFDKGLINTFAEIAQKTPDTRAPKSKPLMLTDICQGGCRAGFEHHMPDREQPTPSV